jgi:hypothetical protein
MNDKELIDLLFARIEGWIVNACFEDEKEKLFDAVCRIEALVAELKTFLDAKIEALTAENEWWKQFAHNVERAAAHGLAGDASIALNEIKREARLALEKQP